MNFIKMDRRTEQYLNDHMNDMCDEQFTFECCKECNSKYLEEVGHYCGDSVNIPLHDIEEGDVIEPIKIIPRSSEIDNEEALDNVFGVLRGE